MVASNRIKKQSICFIHNQTLVIKEHLDDLCHEINLFFVFLIIIT